jgi:hypothetical protein
MDKKKEVLFYITKDGKCPIKNWLKKLDLKSRGRINVRLQRLEYGAYGDYKQISSNLYELRFFLVVVIESILLKKIIILFYY